MTKKKKDSLFLMNYQKKEVVFYQFHHDNDRVELFLLSNFQREKTKFQDIYIICNNPQYEYTLFGKHGKYEELHSICKHIFFRHNYGYDFGGYIEILHHPYEIKQPNNGKNKKIYEMYDTFLFINSSVSGPFFEKSKMKNQLWISYIFERFYLQRKFNNVKLFGPTIHLNVTQIHVQSFMFVFDFDTLCNIFLKKEHFFDLNRHNNNNKPYSTGSLSYFSGVIKDYELKMSQYVLEKKYNIGSLQKCYKNMNFIILHDNVQIVNKDIKVAKHFSSLGSFVPDNTILCKGKLPLKSYNKENDIHKNYKYFERIPILRNFPNLINKDPMYSWEVNKTIEINQCVFIKGNRIRF